MDLNNNIKINLGNNNSELIKLVSSLFESVTVTHMQHLITKSYATHMALNGFYSELPDLIDRLIETYQGKYGIITNYKPITIIYSDDPIDYLNSKVKMYEKNRLLFTDGYIQQIIDDIIELHYSTLYKLKNLK